MSKPYDYVEYQKDCAWFGFTATPMSEAEFKRAAAVADNDPDVLYSIGCDLNAGFELDELLAQLRDQTERAIAIAIAEEVSS